MLVTLCICVLFLFFLVLAFQLGHLWQRGVSVLQPNANWQHHSVWEEVSAGATVTLHASTSFSVATVNHLVFNEKIGAFLCTYAHCYNGVITIFKVEGQIKGQGQGVF